LIALRPHGEGEVARGEHDLVMGRWQWSTMSQLRGRQLMAGGAVVPSERMLCLVDGGVAVKVQRRGKWRGEDDFESSMDWMHALRVEAGRQVVWSGCSAGGR
jgi:hypothetical protein